VGMPSPPSVISDPGVENGIPDVGEQVTYHRGNAEEEDDAELDRIILVADRSVEGEARPLEVEDLLGNEAGGEDGRKGEAEQGDDSDEGVWQHMPKVDG